MLEEDNKILKYNPGEKSLKVLFIIYADLEKTDTCQDNPKESYAEKKKLNIKFQVTHGLHAVYSINQKANKIVIEEKTVW